MRGAVCPLLRTVDGVLSAVFLVGLCDLSACAVLNTVHAVAQITRQRVDSFEDARCRGLALGVGLGLDCVHVGGAGREALASTETPPPGEELGTMTTGLSRIASVAESRSVGDKSLASWRADAIAKRPAW